MHCIKYFSYEKNQLKFPSITDTILFTNKVFHVQVRGWGEGEGEGRGAITSQEFYLLSHRTLLFSVEIEGNQY